jgi:hypothetical protein
VRAHPFADQRQIDGLANAALAEDRERVQRPARAEQRALMLVQQLVAADRDRRTRPRSGT